MYKHKIKKFIIVSFMICANCLTPSDIKYIPSKLPQTDIKVITNNQLVYISRNWYEKIMNNFYNTFDMDHIKNNNDLAIMNNINNYPYNYVLAQINRMESILQNNNANNQLYMAWMPQSENANTRSILSLMICAHVDKEIILLGVLYNPCISSDNIDIIHLRDALLSLSSDSCKVNIDDFCNDAFNIRFKLDWYGSL